MRKHPPPRIVPSQITPAEVFHGRRALLAAAISGGLGGMLPAFGDASPAAPAGSHRRNARYSTDEPLNSFEDISGYNNFYEFGTDKSAPKENARAFRTKPWSVAVDGEAEVTGRFTLEDLLKPHPLEERVYRLRCVERWSMVIPWLGFPLADLLARFKPTSKARYLELTTLHDPRQMPGQRFPVLDWPYVEGLRMDEAMHPLAFMVVGVYGRPLPNQNGAPLRLAVPWKYGFKSVKSIVRIRFTERQPRTAWNSAAPNEYGFYANVNPDVDHPRWSQANERRLGRPIFSQQQATLPFNGYAADVAGLYKGMDLRRHF